MLRLARIGGKNPNLMVRRCMQKIFKDSVLDKYTWCGTLTKAPFQEFKTICETIFLAVRRNFKKYTEYRFEAYMVEYLKHSGTRQRSVKKERKLKPKNYRLMQAHDEEEDSFDTQGEINDENKDESDSEDDESEDNDGSEDGDGSEDDDGSEDGDEIEVDDDENEEENEYEYENEDENGN